METVKIGVRVKDRDYRNALLRGLSHESRDFQFAVIEDGAEGGLPEDCQIILTDDPETEKVCESGYTSVNDTAGREYHVRRGNSEHGGFDHDRKIDQKRKEAIPVITLTHHEMYDMGYRKGRMEIFRYEDARVFVNKIIYYYAKEKGIDLYFHGKRKSRKIVFSSMRGGCGTTAAAMASARFIKFRFDKKILFLSLCPIDGSREYTGACDGGNMISLLYHLSTGDDVPLCKFISSQDGVDHIRGQKDNRAAAEMTVKEMENLLKMIDNMGQYDFIFIDTGSHLSSLARFLIDGADMRVVMRQKGDIEEDGGFDREKQKSDRVINVLAFDDGAADKGDDEVTLAYDPESFIPGDKRTYIDIRGRYGKDISVLAEKIMGCTE